ncbi:BBE domain-containing protein [Geodermatophilus sp. URMC 65]
MAPVPKMTCRGPAVMPAPRSVPAPVRVPHGSRPPCGRAGAAAGAAVLLTGIGATTPHVLELRHLGGALARPAAVPNAVGHRDAAFNLFTSAHPGPGFSAAVAMQTELYRRLLPRSGGRSVYIFTARPDGRPADARGAFEAPVLSRLQSVKAAWDPQDLFRFAVTIPPAGTTDRADVDSPRSGAAPLPGSA